MEFVLFVGGFRVVVSGAFKVFTLSLIGHLSLGFKGL